jgi:hypothetical protein
MTVPQNDPTGHFRRYSHYATTAAREHFGHRLVQRNVLSNEHKPPM